MANDEEKLNPLNQLVRRYLISKTQEEYNRKIELLKENNIYVDNENKEMISGEGLTSLLNKLARYEKFLGNDKKENLNEMFDKLTKKELTTIVETKEEELLKSLEYANNISSSMASAFAKEQAKSKKVGQEKENASMKIDNLEKQTEKDNQISKDVG